MNGAITKTLLNCLKDEDTVDTEKFYNLYPYNEVLEKKLIELKNHGYVTLDYGENKITEIGINQKLHDLLKANR